MKRILGALLLSLSFSSALSAKGLDKLQPTTDEDKETDEEDDSQGIVDRDGNTKGQEKKDEVATEKKGDGKNSAKPATKEPEVPIAPGFQDWYLGASLSYINIDGREGEWHSGSMGDVELGYRLTKKYLEKFDLYLTGRYRPTDVTIDLNKRAYRGVLETYLAGVKGQMDILPRLIAFGSGEFGIARTAVSAIDGIHQVDGSLEKSGVDLVVGGGVSYLVLEKLALGTQLHLGVGTHKSVQFGVDLRFLL